MRLQFAERRRLIFSEWRFHVTEMCVTCDPIYIPHRISPGPLVHIVRAVYAAPIFRTSPAECLTGAVMSASSARLKAVESVKNYTPPTQIFPSPDAPGKIFGQNVFSKSVMQARLAEGSVQVGDLDHRAFQAPRPGRCRRRRLGDEGLGDGKRCDTLRTRLLPAHRADSREARQLPRTGRRRFLDSRVRGEDPRPGRARCFQLPRRWSIRSTS